MCCGFEHLPYTYVIAPTLYSPELLYCRLHIQYMPGDTQKSVTASSMLHCAHLKMSLLPISSSTLSFHPFKTFILRVEEMMLLMYNMHS